MKYELKKTQEFNDWFAGLKDKVNKRLLLARLGRAENGHFGDFKRLSTDLFEMRCFFGGGLRMYYTFRDQQIILLLAGGDKTSQDRDIEKAGTILDNLED
jgi:putative addiction module killer protein